MPHLESITRIIGKRTLITSFLLIIGYEMIDILIGIAHFISTSPKEGKIKRQRMNTQEKKK